MYLGDNRPRTYQTNYISSDSVPTEVGTVKVDILGVDTSKAIELLEKSGHIGILLPKHPSLDILVSAEAILRNLESEEKKFGLTGAAPNLPQKSSGFLQKLSCLKPLPKEMVVSLDTGPSPVSGLRYEKEEARLNIILSPKSGPIERDSFSFSDGKTKCDCILALGVADAENLETTNEAPELISETPIINIDAGSDNRNYGEVNLVDEGRASVSEVVYLLLSKIKGAGLDKSSATLLLAGIISSTEGFRSRSNADTMLVASELLRLGADQELSQKISAQEVKPLSFLQLLGRASVRSKIDENRGILWSFLTAEDFEKTGRSTDDPGSVLKHLENEFPPHKISVLLRQNPVSKTIGALLGGQRQILEALQEKAGGEFKSPYLELGSSFATFREAEEHISSVLVEILPSVN